LVIIFGLIVAPFSALAFNIHFLKMGMKEYEVDSLTEEDLYISQILGERFMKKEKFGETEEIFTKIDDSLQIDNLLSKLSDAKNAQLPEISPI
jgi:hypothetical protein